MNAADILKYGHLTVLRTLEGIPERDSETGGVCGVWSVKDIIGHLAAFELVLVDLLCSLVGEAETPYLDLYRQGPQFNDDQAARRKDHPLAQVLAEYNQAHARVMALVPQISVETWRRPGTLPWYGAEYDLEDFIVYTYYGHKREHCAQINVFRDRLNAR